MSTSSSQDNSESKILFIGKAYGPQKRGAHVVASRFCDENYQNCVYSEALDIKKHNLYDLQKQYKSIVFTFQVPKNYNLELTPIVYNKMGAMAYIRNPLYAKLCTSISNGFSYFCESRSHKFFIPYICDYPHPVSTPEDITLGFYTRIHCNYDSFYYICDYLKNTSTKVNIVTMGDNICNFLKFPMVNTWKHTFDTATFFNSITHYVFPLSAVFKDPFPNTLLEAIQTKKQIVCPVLDGRNFKDGCDDILELIQFHSDMNFTKSYENPNHGLTSNNFKNFYTRVFAAGYKNQLSYDKYSHFYDWLSHEL